MSDPLSTTFAALADPTRRAILARLTQGPATVQDLSAPFAISGPAISRHLRVLEHAGLISRGREAQWRPCRLEAAPLAAVSEWTESYRRFWDESLDRLDAYLQEVQGSPPKKPAARSTTPNGSEPRHGRSRRKK